MMTWLIKIVLPFLVLGSAAFHGFWLYQTRPKTERVERTELNTLVEVIPAKPGKHHLWVTGMGTVIPARQINLSPEVGGRIIEHSPHLVPGGTFRADTEILRIDERDYKFALARKEAEVEQARFALKVERGRQTVAAREWKLLGKEVKTSGVNQDLALRKPHLANAIAALEAAESGLEKAKLDISRTIIKAPFNALVLDETCEIGQLVNPQARLATLVGTDQFWVQVAIPVDRLNRITLPDNKGNQGAIARIVQETTKGTAIVRQGRIVRLLGNLDPVGRMARLLIAIDDPLGQQSGAGKSNLPLLLGAYVRVDISGGEMTNLYKIPRTAIHEDSRLWLMTPESRLEIRPVSLFWRDQEFAYLRKGLSPDEKIITSRIPIPAAGLKLRLATEVDNNGK